VSTDYRTALLDRSTLSRVSSLKGTSRWSQILIFQRPCVYAVDCFTDSKVASAEQAHTAMLTARLQQKVELVSSYLASMTCATIEQGAGRVWCCAILEHVLLAGDTAGQVHVYDRNTLAP